MSDAAERDAAAVGEAVSGVRPPRVRDADPGPAPRGLLDTLHHAERGGDPLGPSDRSYFEPRLGRDLGTVRLHAGPRDAALSRNVGASAFTHGTHVHLGDGWSTAPAPQRRGLLAHELAHVAQQLDRPTPGRIFRQPAGVAPEAVTRMDIFLGSGTILITTRSGANYRMRLDRGRTTLPPTTPGVPYSMTHTGGVREEGKHVKITGVEGSWSWRYLEPEGDEFRFAASPTATFPLYVHEAVAAPAGEGAGKKGEGAGDKGKGAGEKGKGEGEQPKPGAPPATAKASDAEVAAFKDALKKAGVEGTGAGGDKLRELLAGLDAAGVKDFIDFLKDNKSDAEGLDFEKLAEDYKKLKPSERELLKVNRLMARDETGTAKELPEEVRLAITTGAERSAELSQQAAAVDKDLAAIQAAITPDDKVKKGDLDPIDLAKLPAFNEMMMLQGLLAGASQRSPDVQDAAKELIGTIGEVRSYVMEEIAWMAAEMAAGSVIAALLAAPTGGGSAVIMGARVAHLAVRLNKLRKFLQRIERVYSTYQYVETAIVQVTRLTKGYATFKADYDRWMREWEELEAKLDDESLDEALQDELTLKLEELEDKLIEEMQKQIESPAGLGGMLESFAIPAHAGPDDIKRILMDIPRGVELLEDLGSFYRSGGTGDLEYTRTLAFKATATGYLLYPFVNFLAMQVTNKLQDIMQEKDLGDRVMEMFARSAPRKRRGLPKPAEAKGKLKGVKTHKAKKAETKKAEEEAAKKAPKKPPEDPKKKKGEEPPPPEDPAAKKKREEDDEWAKVKAKVAALRSHYGDAGVTQDDLVAAGRRIRKQHPTVAKAPKVGEVADRGEWRLVIERKGLPPAEARADVWMSIRTRWGKGVRAVERKLTETPAVEARPSPVTTRVEPVKEPYNFSSLTGEKRRDGRDGAAVRGRMGTQAERDIAMVDDVTGLHQGTSTDPIPIHFYKQRSNYKQRIAISDNYGRKRDYDMTSADEINWVRPRITTPVRVGIEAKNIVVEGATLRRGSMNRRTGTQQNYRDALEYKGFDWSPGGRELDADHVLDLGFGGTDTYDNLWPLDARVNRHAYDGSWYSRYTVVYLDPAKPTEAQEASLYKLPGKHFLIIGFDTTPKIRGGRDKATAGGKP